MTRNRNPQLAYHKGIKLSKTDRGWLIHASIRPKYYATLTQARKAIDQWETRQYKRDKRKFD